MSQHHTQTTTGGLASIVCVWTHRKLVLERSLHVAPEGFRFAVSPEKLIQVPNDSNPVGFLTRNAARSDITKERKGDLCQLFAECS